MRKTSLLAYDLVGAAVACGVAALGAWCAFYHVHVSVDRQQRARTALSSATTQLAEIESALRQARVERARLAADITQRGALPQRTPIEEDLRELTQLARGNGVELVQVTPMPQEKYPGLVEIRYAVQARSDFTSLVAFLRGFETSNLWADITGLNIGGSAGRAEAVEGERSSALVVSFFQSQENVVVPQN